MRDTKEIRSGMQDEIILSGPGYLVFHGRDARCFQIDGGIEDHKNHFMTEKTPNNDHLYERFTGLLVTYNQCVLVLDPLELPLVLGPVVTTPYNELWLCARLSHAKVTQLQSLFS